MESSGPSATGDRSSLPPHDVHARPGTGSSTKRTNDGHRLVDRMPKDLKRVVFESSQERFEHTIRQEHVVATAPGDKHISSRNVQPGSRPLRHPLGSSPTVMPNRMDSSSAPAHNQTDPDDDTSDFMEGSLFCPSSTTRGTRRFVDSHHSGSRNSRTIRPGSLSGKGTKTRPRKKRSTSRSPIVKVRCKPGDVLSTIQMLTPEQRAAIEDDGFGQFLKMKTCAADIRNLIPWLLDNTNPNDMQINIGPGKVLPITPCIIRMVLGLPAGGARFKIYSPREGDLFRQQLIHDLNQDLTEDTGIHISHLQKEIKKGNVDALMKRCFFMILCNRLLLPTSNYNIGSLDIKRTMDPQLFSSLDWSHAVFNDLQLAIKGWHARDQNQLTHTIYGCTLFLTLYYLDNIHHHLSPEDWTSTPRIAFFDRSLIEALTKADAITQTDGVESYAFLPFKTWSSTCYAAANVRAPPWEHMGTSSPQLPRLQLPQLRELLAEPISGLSGAQKDRLQSFFQRFDDILCQNTRTIEECLGNIASAQTHLSEQCRPIIQELASSQNDNPVDTSRTTHQNSDDATRDAVHRSLPSPSGQDNYPHSSFVSAGTLLRSQITEHGTYCNIPASRSHNPISPTDPFGSPIDENVVSSHQNLDKSPCPSTIPMHLSHQEADGPTTTPLHTCGEDVIGLSTSGGSILPDVPVLSLQSPIHAQPMAPGPDATMEGFSRNTSTPEVNHESAGRLPRCEHDSDAPVLPNVTDKRLIIANADGSTSVLKEQVLYDVPSLKLPGKRLTKKPFKFCSPFKAGIISRPPPNTDLSLRMHALLCASDSPLKWKTLMHFGTSSLTGQDIASSFGDGMFIASVFMDAFVKCITEDDLFVRHECTGYRIFLEPLLSDILKTDSTNSDQTLPQSKVEDAVASIQRCLPPTNLKKAKLIFLPVLHLQHWSVYCINLGQARIDVLDSMNYSCNPEATWDSYHTPMGRLIMQRLSVAMSKAAPRQFSCFENWRHAPGRVPFQLGTNDSGLFAMKFIEFYDGEGHGSLKTIINPVRSVELRAEMLHYIAFHTANNIRPPAELQSFRILDALHPHFDMFFY